MMMLLIEISECDDDDVLIERSEYDDDADRNFKYVEDVADRKIRV